MLGCFFCGCGVKGFEAGVTPSLLTRAVFLGSRFPSVWLSVCPSGCPSAEPADEGRGVLGRGARVQDASAAELRRAGGYPGLRVLAVHGACKALCFFRRLVNVKWCRCRCGRGRVTEMLWHIRADSHDVLLWIMYFSAVVRCCARAVWCRSGSM